MTYQCIRCGKDTTGVVHWWDPTLVGPKYEVPFCGSCFNAVAKPKHTDPVVMLSTKRKQRIPQLLKSPLLPIVIVVIIAYILERIIG